MTTTANTVTENNIEHQKFDTEILKRKVDRYEKLVRFIWLGMGIFCMLLMAFLPIAYFFIGTSKFFAVKFSIPAFADWLKSLPSVRITDPEGQLARLILGLLFFLVYIILSIILIKNLVKTIKKFISLCDLKNSHIDHKEMFLDIVNYTTTTYAAILSFGLLSLSSTDGRMQPIVIVLLFLYGVFFFATTVGKNLYVCYDVKKGVFYKKVFFINVVKRFFLVVISSLLLALCLEPQLLIFVGNIMENYNNTTHFTSIAAINKFVFPWISWFLVLLSVLIFKNTIKINVLDLRKSVVSTLYDQAYPILDKNKMFQQSIKNKAVSIIVFAILSFVLQLLFVCFNSANKFVLPDDLGAFVKQFTFIYTPIILLALAATWTAKTKETTPIQSNN